MGFNFMDPIGLFDNDNITVDPQKQGNTDFEASTIDDVNAFLGGLDMSFLGGGGGGGNGGGGGGGGGGGKGGGGGGGGSKSLNQTDILTEDVPVGNDVLSDPNVAEGLQDYITTTLQEDPNKIYELDPGLADEAASLRAQMLEAGGDLADLSPEDQAEFETMLTAELAMSERGFETMKNDFLTRMFGSGTEQSTIAGDIGGRLVGDQQLVEQQIRAANAGQQLGMRQFLTQNKMGALGMASENLNQTRMAELQRLGLVSADRASQMGLSSNVFGALSDAQSRIAQARLSADAELKSASMQANATVKAAKAQANAMVSSARIGAAADKYATRATLATQMYGMNQADKQFGYELDYKYYATDSQTLIAQQQMPTMGDKLLGVVSAAAGMAGGAAMMSDRRLKTDIVPKGAGYTWRWIMGGYGEGAIAQELELVAPHAVITVRGVKMVDYGRLL
jgi:hypothetical protein